MDTKVKHSKGTFAPQTHLTAASATGPFIGSVMGKIIGQNVMVFDPISGNLRNLLTLNTADGTSRPAGLEFSLDGKALYVASVGLTEIRSISLNGAVLEMDLNSNKATWLEYESFIYFDKYL